MPSLETIDYGQFARSCDRSRRIEPAIADAILRSLHALGARSILELGAGTGNYTGAFVADGFSVIALDRAPAMVAIGAPKVHAAWLLADAGRLPLHRDSVDAVAGVNVLHHLPELATTLAEVPPRCACRRRLAGGGPRKSRDPLVSPLFSRD